jgi:hypothetical protein
MTKLCIIKHKIDFCNSRCPNFFHNYEDKENCYCMELRKKVYDFGYRPDVYEDVFGQDSIERPIPADCPLPDI